MKKYISDHHSNYYEYYGGRDSFRYDSTSRNLEDFFDRKEVFKYNDEKLGNLTTHVYLRKWDNKGKQSPVRRQDLEKQIYTFWKKANKVDNTFDIQYAIEGNWISSTYFYHSHLIVHHSNPSNLVSQFKRFIGYHSDSLDKYYINENNYRFAEVYGDFGYCDFWNVYEYKGLCKYLDKTTEGLKYVREGR